MEHRDPSATVSLLETRPETNGRAASRRRFLPIYLCLLIPFAGLLWTPLYNRIEPTVLGIPFFYWYQMLWTVLGAVAIVPVYLYEERRRR